MLNVAWEREEYIFREDDGNVNVSLVTTAILERLVTLEGEPRAITRTEGLDRISNGIQSITVQSPFGPKDINLVEYKGVQYTLARVLPCKNAPYSISLTYHYPLVHTPTHSPTINPSTYVPFLSLINILTIHPSFY